MDGSFAFVTEWPGMKRLVFLAVLVFAACRAGPPHRTPPRTWRVYGGKPEGTRYSPLDQINRDNVKQLEVAWSYDSREEGGLQTNPIVVDDVVYVTTPKHRVVALDAAAGAVRWR